jgi:hypothetical protein
MSPLLDAVLGWEFGGAYSGEVVPHLTQLLEQSNGTCTCLSEQ